MQFGTCYTWRQGIGAGWPAPCWLINHRHRHWPQWNRFPPAL